MTSFRASLKEVWSRLTWPDLVSTGVAAGGLLASIFAFNGGFFCFLKYLAVLAGIYLLFRFIGWWGSPPFLGPRNTPVFSYLFFSAGPPFSVAYPAPPSRPPS